MNLENGPIEVLQVEDGEENTRLDLFLTQRLPHLSRARLQRLIGTHAVTIDDQPVKASYRTRYGDTIFIDIPDAKPLDSVQPESIALDIVFEDSDIIVVNKSKGLVVHPAPGSETGTLVNALLAHCGDLSGIGGALRPGIVHRLDKDTTGLIVVAKNDLAHIGLSKQIQERTAVRKYNALLCGRLPFKHAVIDAAISRHPGDRKRMAVVQSGDMGGPAPRARSAVTEVRILEHLFEFSWIEAILQTGRTHQIRVHMAFAGYPVAGDITYGGQRKISADVMRGMPLQTLNHLLGRLHGQALHAHALAFDHPRTGKRLQFHAPLPDEIAELLDYLRRINEAYEV